MYALVSVTSMLATRGRRTASGKQTPDLFLCWRDPEGKAATS